MRNGTIARRPPARELRPASRHRRPQSRFCARLYIIETANRPVSHIYFPRAGIASVVARSAPDQIIEVGLIGRDGMTGCGVILGSDRSPNDVNIQIAGDGMRVEATWRRYGKPMILSETSAEGVNAENWLRYVAGEVRCAQAQGIPVLGMCIYPVMDYPGWLDGRHCECGIIALDADFNRRVSRGLDINGLIKA